MDKIDKTLNKSVTSKFTRFFYGVPEKSSSKFLCVPFYASIDTGCSNAGLFLFMIALLMGVIYYFYRESRKLKSSYEKTLESLKDQQELFDLLMEYSPIYVFFKDENIRAMKLSKNYINLLGMPASEAIGKTMDDLFPSDFAKKMIQDDLKILNGDSPVKLIEEFNGRTYITLKFPIRRSNNSKIMAGFTIDITDQKKVERDLMIAKRQAEEANEAKSLFLANMSHELRTPMNGIIGFTNLMATSGLNEKQLEYNEMIKASADHLLELINDLLDFSKLEAKKLKLDLSPFDIIQTAKDSVDIMAREAEKKNLVLKVEAGAEIDYFVKGDRLRVKQIIINLLSNAIKFTNSGSIVLSINEKERSDSSSVILIKVSDTGIGIPSTRLGDIFDMFTQLDNSVSKKHGGAGLGLSIVKGLVEAMGGKVMVESELGKGSVFSAEVPFETVPKETVANKTPSRFSEPAKTAECKSPLGPLKILLAEDDLINQKFMNVLLTRLGWTIRLARNGREAVEAYKSEVFDAIIMDGQMPEISGFEAAAAIREMEKNDSSRPRVPIIALTAYAMKGDREKFIAAGMDDYIAKPIQDEKKIVEVLQKYVKY